MNSPPLSVALQTYLDKVSVTKKGYQQEKYRANQVMKSELANRPLRSITSVEVSTYRDNRLESVNKLTGKPLSPATVKLELSLLSNLFDIARIEWGWCGDNPVKDIRKPKVPPGRERRLSPREDRLILRYAHNHCNIEWYSIIVLALETAMRQGEILSLRWENINFRTGVAHLPETKNGTKRDVPLNLKARDALTRLSPTPTGKVFGYTQNGVKSTWRYMVQTLGIENLHFHDMRHEACSRFFELGTLDVMEVAAISGHRSLSMLKRYTHLKAHKLVKKLEGGRTRNAQHLARHLVPYPALLTHSSDGYEVTIMDIPEISIKHDSRSGAIEEARNRLLRALVHHMQKGVTISSPDSYLATVDERDLVMIDPLA